MEGDVTLAITETLSMFVETEKARRQMDDYPAVAGETEPNWSPKMGQAIGLLAELQAGRIRCVREGPTDL